MQLARLQIGPQRHDRVGEGGDHTALDGHHLVAFGLGQEAHVLGQHAVFVLRAGIGVHEAFDQGAQALRRVQRQDLNLARQLLQPLHVAGRDVQQQALLVGEVVVQRRLGHAAGGGHLVHRGGGVAVPREEFGCAGEDLLALVVVGGSARSGH